MLIKSATRVELGDTERGGDSGYVSLEGFVGSAQCYADAAHGTDEANRWDRPDG